MVSSEWRSGIEPDIPFAIPYSPFALSSLLQRLNEILDRYGDDTVVASISELRRRAADQMRAHIATMADGVYRSEAYVDSDGVVNEPLTIALAIEKQGDAKARVTLNQMKAEAEGLQAQGMAEVKIKEAAADAIAKTGRAEAEAKRELMLAEAVGSEQQGMAKAKVKEADATATEKMGQAKAVEIREKLMAEAQGLEQKAEAMKKLDERSRSHEEYRLRLEKLVEVEMAALGVRRDVAKAQAEVLGAAMGSAKINIVGGDGQFFDQFIRAVSLGQALDGVVHNSDTAKTLMAGYLDGEKSLTDDIKAVLSRPAIDTTDVKNLSVSAALHKVMGELGQGQQGKIQALIARAKELGLD